MSRDRAIFQRIAFTAAVALGVLTLSGIGAVVADWSGRSYQYYWLSQVTPLVSPVPVALMLLGAVTTLLAARDTDGGDAKPLARAYAALGALGVLGGALRLWGAYRSNMFSMSASARYEWDTLVFAVVSTTLAGVAGWVVLPLAKLRMLRAD